MTATRVKPKPAVRKAPPRKRAAKKPEPLTSVTIEVPRLLLANALKNVLATIGNNPLRPVLNAARFEFGPNLTRIIATDSYRLLVQEFPREGTDEVEPFLLARSDVVLFEKLARPVTVKLRKRGPVTPPEVASVAFVSDRVTLSAATISASASRAPGEYPNWSGLTNQKSLNGAEPWRKRCCAAVVRKGNLFVGTDFAAGNLRGQARAWA